MCSDSYSLGSKGHYTNTKFCLGVPDCKLQDEMLLLSAQELIGREAKHMVTYDAHFLSPTSPTIIAEYKRQCGDKWASDSLNAE